MVWEVVISFSLTCHSGPYGSIEMNSKSPLSTAIPEARQGRRSVFSPLGGRGAISSNTSARHWGFPGGQQRGGPASPSSPTEEKKRSSRVRVRAHTATHMHTRARVHTRMRQLAEVSPGKKGWVVGDSGPEQGDLGWDLSRHLFSKSLA